MTREPVEWEHPVREFYDERRTAPAVREWSSVRGGRRRIDEDRTRVARALYAAGLPKHEIADIVGVHWAQLDRVLNGQRVIQP